MQFPQFFVSLVFAILMAFYSSSCYAFVVVPTRPEPTTTTVLHAWSIPTMTTDMSMLASSFASPQLQHFDPTRSWYTESTATRRRTIYHDLPGEYSLISPGGDWPSMDAVEAANTQAQKQMRSGPLKPLRQAARWARRVL